jgi:excisionase family DNA binding protein
MIEEYFTLEEVAEKLKIGTITLKRAIAAGELRAISLGGYKVTEQAINAWLKTKRVVARNEETNDQ